MYRLFIMVGVLLASGCTSVPDGIEPVDNFDVNRYLGTWYEVARLDHSFERNLENVSAEYSLRPDGGIRVVNRGQNAGNKQWKEAIGKAYFVEAETVGRLKVSFFGPFYGGYNIVRLDENYQMALVVGPSTDYAWILSRSEQPAASLCESYFQTAEQIGINDSRWIKLRACQ